MTTTTAHDVEPRFQPGESFDVMNLTTGRIGRYTVLTDLGFEDYVVRIDTGRPARSRWGGTGFRASDSTKVLMGGATLSALQTAGLL